MKTGLTKKQKVTEVYFDERDEIAEIHTHNTELKKRLAAYAKKYPKRSCGAIIASQLYLPFLKKFFNLLKHRNMLRKTSAGTMQKPACWPIVMHFPLDTVTSPVCLRTIELSFQKVSQLLEFFHIHPKNFRLRRSLLVLHCSVAGSVAVQHIFRCAPIARLPGPAAAISLCGGKQDVFSHSYPCSLSCL